MSIEGFVSLLVYPLVLASGADFYEGEDAFLEIFFSEFLKKTQDFIQKPHIP